MRCQRERFDNQVKLLGTFLFWWSHFHFLFIVCRCGHIGSHCLCLSTWFIIIYYDLLYLLTWFGWTSAGQCNVLVGVQHFGLPTWSLKCIHMLFCCIKWNTDDKWIWIVTVLHFTILSKSSSRPLLSYLLVRQLGPISPSLNWTNYLSGYVVTTAGLTLVLHWLTVWTPLASNKPQQSSCSVGFPVIFFLP